MQRSCLHIILGKLDSFSESLRFTSSFYNSVVILITIVIATESLRVLEVLSKWIQLDVEVAVTSTPAAVLCNQRHSRRHCDLQSIHVCRTDFDAMNFIFYLFITWRFGAVGSDVDRINEVILRRTRLVLGWVTVSGFNSRCGKFISV